MDNSDWVAGKLGNALHFDGVDDYVVIPGYKGITGTASRTCCAWIKTSDSTWWKDIIGWGNIEAGQRWLVTISPEGFVQIAVVDGYQRGTMAVNDGQWHHIAVVLADDGSPSTNEIKIYIDGIQEGSYSTLTAPINTGSTPNVQIGFYNDTSNRYFNGLIDDVRIYDRALSAAEIAKISQ